MLSTASSRTPIDHPALAENRGCPAGRVYGLEPIVFPSIGASGPNFVFTNILRQPCFLIPFAGVDQCNHGPNENFALDGFFNGIRTAVGLFEALARVRLKIVVSSFRAVGQFETIINGMFRF